MPRSPLSLYRDMLDFQEPTFAADPKTGRDEATFVSKGMGYGMPIRIVDAANLSAGEEGGGERLSPSQGWELRDPPAVPSAQPGWRVVVNGVNWKVTNVQREWLTTYHAKVIVTAEPQA